MVRSGSDNAYGVYLTQLVFINALVWLGWEQLTGTVPWPLLCLLTVVVVYLASFALTSLLARTPLAVPLTGRKQVAWATLLPRWHPQPLKGTDCDSDSRVDRPERQLPWRYHLPGGRRGNRDADLRGAAALGLSVGALPGRRGDPGRG
jgi:hypothetical protein